MAATEALRRHWRALAGFLGSLVAGGAVAPTQAATLPEDHAEAMLHSYDGGGVKANGPALLVRKSVFDSLSLSGQYYVDAVSNASIDVVTTASPFKETRTAYTLGGDYVNGDATLSVSLDTSTEPDYHAHTLSVDTSQDTFGGMTTVRIGFTHGNDDVGKKTIGFFDRATHWQYRAGVTQILTPRWLASLNLEAVADEGYLGSPYRAAIVFGATVPERVPRTRSSRAMRLSTIGDIGTGSERLAVRGEFRHFWDNWGIKAETLEAGASRYFGSRWLADVSARWYSQDKALFYSDNAPTETQYVTRNRQLSTFTSWSLAGKATYTLGGSAAKYGVKLTAGYERKQFTFSDFTDVRTGKNYAYGANIFQVFVSANY